MNVIILCMVSFLLLIKKTMSAIIKVQYKTILWFFRKHILIANIVNSLHLFQEVPTTASFISAVILMCKMVGSNPTLFPT